MKIALILTGQLRTIELTKWFHKKTFLNNSNCDIFLSIDPTNNTQLLYKNDTNTTEKTMIDNIIDFYKPKDFYIGNENDEKNIFNNYKNLINKTLLFYDIGDIDSEEKQKDINKILIDNENQYMIDKIDIKQISHNNGKKNMGILTEDTIKGLFKQFYFVHKGYELLNNYINKNNEKYDIIIRMRFDHILLTEQLINYDLINFDKLDNILLYNDKNILLAQSLKDININFDCINNNSINVMGAGIFKKYVYVNDFFWTHGSDLIIKMLNFYPQLNSIIDFSTNNYFPIYGAGIEHFFAIFLHNNNIIINQTIMNKCNIIRQK
jgi:hypothetical protein